MSHLVLYWQWEVPGPYYGMPWVNFAGWALTGIVLMSVLEVLDRRIDWAGEVPVRWALFYHIGIVMMPTGMLLAAGKWPAVIFTLACGAVAFGIHGAATRGGTPDTSQTTAPRERMAREGA